MNRKNRNFSMPPKRTIESSDSLVEELHVEKQYGKNIV